MRFDTLHVKVEENGWGDEGTNEVHHAPEQLISAPAEFGNPGGAAEVEVPAVDVGALNGKRSFEEQYVLTNGQGLRARALYDYQAGNINTRLSWFFLLEFGFLSNECLSDFDVISLVRIFRQPFLHEFELRKGNKPSCRKELSNFYNLYSSRFRGFFNFN